MSTSGSGAAGSENAGSSPSVRGSTAGTGGRGRKGGRSPGEEDAVRAKRSRSARRTGDSADPRGSDRSPQGGTGTRW